MGIYEKKKVKWLIDNPGGLFLTRRTGRYAERWGIKPTESGFYNRK